MTRPQSGFARRQRKATHARNPASDSCSTKASSVPKDYVKAFKWFRLAAQKGDVSAEYSLGLMYYKGWGIPKDDALAYKWFRLAAQKGITRAQYNLGVIYASRGVPKNYVEGYKWLSLAAAYERDDERRKGIEKLRDFLEKEMTPQERAEAQRQAAEWRPRK